MATDVEIERALAAVTATVNEQQLDAFDADRVQRMVNEALAGEMTLTVDPGGGLHDESGTRVGAIRRTDSGEWISERQNDTAERADSAIPAAPEAGKHGLLRKLLG